MRYSYVDNTADGETSLFDVPFGYLAKAHVSVLVDGVEAPFTWFNSTTIQLEDVPAEGAVVRRKRTTPKDTPIVDFSDASTLTESELDLSTLQNLYVAQEADDKAEDIRQSAIDAAVEVAVPAATEAATEAATAAAIATAVPAATAAAVAAAVPEAIEQATAAATAAAVAEATEVAEQVATETSRSVPEVESGDTNKVLVATPVGSPPYAWLDPLTPIMAAATAAQAAADAAQADADTAQATAVAAGNEATSALIASAAANTNANGRVSKSGDTMTGELSIQPASGTAANLSVITTGAANASVDIRAPNQRASAVYLRTGSAVRWGFYKGGENETGSGNAGSDFHLTRYNDAGTAIADVLQASRATGAINVIGALTIGGAVTCGGSLSVTGDSTWAMYTSGGTRVTQYGAGWYWGWNTATGDLQWNMATGNYFQLRVDGSLIWNGGSAWKLGGGVWSDLSDRRTKRNIRDYTAGLSEILSLQPRQWNAHPDTGRDPNTVFVGGVADELYEVLPEMICPAPQPVTIEGETITDLLGVDASVLPWALVNAVKELSAKLDAATARIAQLEGTSQ